MKRIGLLSSLLLVALCATRVEASAKGKLVVTVSDEDGSLLPGVTVLLSTDSGLGSGRYGLRVAITNEHGHAIFFNLPPDDFIFNATFEGFASRRGLIDVYAGVTRHLQLQLSTEFLECSLGERSDFRDTLDPGMPPSLTIVSNRRQMR